MLVILIYAVAVFVLCFISIWFLRRKILALLIVAAWTFLGPILMQVLVYFQLGYLDPFWKWAATIQGAIALGAASTAAGVWSVLEKDE